MRIFTSHARDGLRDKLLDQEPFDTLTEPRVMIEECCRHWRAERPYSRLGHCPPAPESRATACRAHRASVINHGGRLDGGFTLSLYNAVGWHAVALASTQTARRSE